MTFAQTLFTIFLYLLGACLLGLALTPPAILLFGLWNIVHPTSLVSKAACLALGLGFGFFLFGLSLIVVTVILRWILNLKLREGEFPYFSFQAVKWAFTNSLMLIVNITFMDFMKLTPLLPFYCRLMGAKVGRRVQMNSKHLADISLLEIGDDSVIGGDAVLIGHIAEHGMLKLKKTAIGKKVTIGLGAVVMPGCRIGDGALIAARSVLAKNTVVPRYTVFAGTPAQLIRHMEPSHAKRES